MTKKTKTIWISLKVLNTQSVGPEQTNILVSPASSSLFVSSAGEIDKQLGQIRTLTLHMDVEEAAGHLLLEGPGAGRALHALGSPVEGAVLVPAGQDNEDTRWGWYIDLDKFVLEGPSKPGTTHVYAPSEAHARSALEGKIVQRATPAEEMLITMTLLTERVKEQA